MIINRKINRKMRTFTLTNTERFAAYTEQNEIYFELDLKTVMKSKGYTAQQIKQVLKDKGLVSIISRQADKASEYQTYPGHIEAAIDECKEQIQNLLTTAATREGERG